MRSAGNFNSEWGYLAPAPSFLRTVRAVLVATAIGATAGAAVVLSLTDHPAQQAERTTSLAAHAIVTSVQAAPAPAPAASAAVVAPVAVTTTASSAPAPVSSPQPQATLQTTPHVTPAIAPQSMPPQVAIQTPPAPPAVHAAVIAQPQPSVLSTPAIENTGIENTGVSDAVVPPPQKPASGMAALSAPSRAPEVTPADTSDQMNVPPDTVPPEKKARHHVAGAYASNAKDRPSPGLGAVLRRIFSPHPGRSYYPSH